MEASVVLQYYHLDHKFFFDLHFRRAYVFPFSSFFYSVNPYIVISLSFFVFST